MSVLKYIRDIDGVLYKVGTKLPDIPTLFIYTVGRASKVHVHLSHNPNYYLKKWRVWTRTGNTARLPAPVARTGLTDVRLYYTQSVTDIDRVKHELSVKCEILDRRLPIRSTSTGVVAIRVDGDNRYHILKYDVNYNLEHILSRFQDRCKELLTDTGRVHALELQKWCREHYRAIQDGTWTIDTVADPMDPIEAMYLTAKYVLADRGACMNLCMPSF